MDEVERSIRELMGTNTHLAERVTARMHKKRRRAIRISAAEEIRSVNEGYFVRPQSTRIEEKLPEGGPEQLRFGFDQ